jgi:predicted phage replisome organizer
MLAGKCNDSGLVYLTKEVPYQPEVLASIMNRPVSIVQFALQQFVTLRMIEIQDSYIAIANWEKYQQKGIDVVREKARIRQENYRNKRKELLSNVTNNVTVTDDSYSYSISNSLFKYWNEKENLITHSKIDQHLSEINKSLNIYSIEQIKSAIDRYNRVTALPNSLYSYKWTLKDFLKRGLHKFVDETPDSNFVKHDNHNSDDDWYKKNAI